MARRVVVVNSKIGAWRDGVIRGVVASLERTAERAASEARSLTPEGDGRSGVLPGHARDSIVVSQPYRTRRGYAVDIGSADPTILWLERGTHARKGRAKRASTTARRRAAGISHSGMRPRRMLRKGLRSAFNDWASVAKRECAISTRSVRVGRLSSVSSGGSSLGARIAGDALAVGFALATGNFDIVKQGFHIGTSAVRREIHALPGQVHRLRGSLVRASRRFA